MQFCIFYRKARRCNAIAGCAVGGDFFIKRGIYNDGFYIVFACLISYASVNAAFCRNNVVAAFYRRQNRVAFRKQNFAYFMLNFNFVDNGKVCIYAWRLYAKIYTVGFAVDVLTIGQNIGTALDLRIYFCFNHTTNRHRVAFRLVRHVHRAGFEIEFDLRRNIFVFKLICKIYVIVQTCGIFVIVANYRFYVYLAGINDFSRQTIAGNYARVGGNCKYAYGFRVFGVKLRFYDSLRIAQKLAAARLYFVNLWFHLIIPRFLQY